MICSRHSLRNALILCAAFLVQPIRGASLPLFVNLAHDHVQAVDARASVLETGRLRVETAQAKGWPGVTLRCPTPLNLSRFASVTVQVRNIDALPVTVYCRVDNPGADGTRNCVTGSRTIQPGNSGTIRVPLSRHTDGKLDGKLFGMRGYPKQLGGDHTVDPSHITQVLVFVSQPSTTHAFELEEIRAEGEFVPPTALVTDSDPFIPFIDTFGQYRHRDWPGKVHSLDELQRRRAEEGRELETRGGPVAWNQYGGWKNGPRLAATGFFRTEKVDGKWWLVDPEGRLFWSHGIDCVRMLDATPIEEREDWFENFPGTQPEFAGFVSRSSVLKGHYAGRTVRTFSFAGANLQRKYGVEWRETFRDLVHQRLRGWGLNTIGNWSDEQVRFDRRTPYVDTIGSGGARRIEGSEGYWGKFPDPYDPGFRRGLTRSMAGKRGKSAGDPWCIGFFTDNEIAWGDDMSLSIAALRSPPDQPAKLAFMADLEAKYGDIQNLNEAWGTRHESWDALRQSRSAPEAKRARPDLEAFYTKLSEAYFRTARDVIQEIAPGQLYLGCRFAWVNARAAAAAAKYCDVVSYNIYNRSVADFRFNGGADVPLIIGEFHFGALDRGMFHTGLVPTASQAERARAYTDYVSSALKHPQFVGCHWFQYQDQPTTGRVLDEENYQIGFVDIADTPNAEIVSASCAIGESLYNVRAETAKPVAVSSPDQTVRFELQTGDGGHLRYSVAFDGKPQNITGTAGILISNVNLGASVELGTPQRRTLSETFAWRGHKTVGTNACEVAEIPVRSRATGTEWTLEVRVFNDGVGFRYRVPGEGERVVTGEVTSWNLPASSKVWFQTNTVNYEGVYQRSPASSIPAGTDLGPPATIEFADGTFGLITEASLYNYSGMTLRAAGEGRFEAAFLDDPNGWTARGEIRSPWRIVLLSRDLNGLVNSDLVPALCDPPDPELFPDGVNTPWIRPGKAPCTWMVYGNDGARWDRQKWFVDVAAATGCEYLLVDAGWRTERWGWLKDGGDLWKRAAELCRYATERNVGIVLWHAYPEGRDDGPGLTSIAAREELFRNCRDAGVKGVKIDFFDSESKEMIDTYEDLLRRSAKYQLLINFHGANKPAGEPRTWPHEVTREGIREQEYILWDSLPLAHYGALPFTRMAVGYGDFLPGYLQERFLKNTTATFQMASLVVFSSPFQCLPDNPEAYLHSPLLQFVRTVPVTWDETRVLPGSIIGDTVIMARRNGEEWYVAVLNCRAEPREVAVDLSWLNTRQKELVLYADGESPSAFAISSGTPMPANGQLKARLRPGGGFVAHLRPLTKFSGWK